MEKRGIVVLLVILLFILLLTGIVNATDIFTDNFNDNDISDWTRSSLLNTGTDNAGPRDGSYYAWFKGGHWIKKTVSTAGYENIKISYYFKRAGQYTVTDFFIIEWKLGSEPDSAYKLLDMNSGVSAWSSLLTWPMTGAENKNINIRFSVDGSSSLKGFVDDVTVSGDAIEGPYCGDNNLDQGEECDDGNQNNNDACKNDCTFNVCGDSVLNSGVEDCDDGNLNNNDNCKNDCSLNICGDGYVYTGVEECDDGNVANGDGCDTNCQLEGPLCGNGIIEGSEECDDGNFNNHDACLKNCLSASCGDGYLWINNEQCDDGNLVSGDGCDNLCNFEGGEQCFAPVDVMLVIDRSGSMAGIKLSDAKSASINFVNLMNFSKDTAGLASFSTSATLDQGLTSNSALVINAINALTASGQTNIGDGIKLARQELIANGGVNKAMVLLSDGAPNAMSLPNGSIRFCFIAPTSPTNCTIYALNQSNITKEAGIEIFTIGLGVSNFTQELLKDIATDDSHYHFAPNSSELESIYLQIAQELCPCQGFDCSINSDNCNIGFCNVQTDECEFDPLQISTPCEFDQSLCTIDHCDGGGSCVTYDNVPVPPPQECKSFFCDPSDGQVKEDYSNYQLSTPCDADDSECTIDHCDGAGSCVNLDSVDCSNLNGQCQIGICNPQDGQCYPDYTDHPLSTQCEADDNLCTVDHCNGSGNCILKNNVDCSNLNGQCQIGICNPQDGQCYPDYSNYPLSYPCQADQSLCTIDHCDGGGSCVTYDNVPVPPPQECKSFFCDPQDGEIKEDYSNFPLSTYCETDDNICTIEHCNGAGSCVINPEAELPPQCLINITKDAKVAQSRPTRNFGNGTYLMVNPKQSGIDRSYLRINAEGLTDNATNASLLLYIYWSGSDAAGQGIEAWYCPDHNFNEMTINWNNQPLDGNCKLADNIIMGPQVVAGAPDTVHTFDLTDEINTEVSSGDKQFTVVIRSADENTGYLTNNKFVQYISSEYTETAYRPQLAVT